MVFDLSTVEAVKASFSDELKVPTSSIEVIRVGENAMFDIPEHDIVLRVYRKSRQAEQKAHMEIQVARVLSDGGVRSIKPSHLRPIILNGDYVATVWERLEKDNSGISSASFGTLLHQVHSAMRDRENQLSCLKPIDPIAKLARRIETLSNTNSVDPNVVGRLNKRLSECEGSWTSFSSSYDWQPIHGDAHTGNVIMHRGNQYICDFDSCGIGPIEWDLVPIQIIARRFKQAEPDLLSDFDKAYGVDPKIRNNLLGLLMVRELSMVTWLAQDAKNDKNRMKQVLSRLESLAETVEPFTAWSPN